jgi:hypothetical protein
MNVIFRPRRIGVKSRRWPELVFRCLIREGADVARIVPEGYTTIVSYMKGE